MTRLEILKKQTENAHEMRCIIDKAKDEKRALTQEEQDKFNALELEQRALQIETMMQQQPGVPAPEGDSVEKRFLEMACDVASGGSSGKASFNVRSVVNFDSVKETSVPVVFQDLLDPLEKGLIVSKLGCKVQDGLNGLPMNAEVDAPEATVLGENEKVSESTLNFTGETPTPKRISMSIPVSRTALNVNNRNLYGIVMRTLGAGIARKVNKIMFTTTAHGKFKGPFVGLTGAQKIQGTASKGWDQGLIVDIEHAVLDSMVEALGGNSAYIMNTKTAAALKKKQLVAADKEMLLQMHIDSNTGYRYGFMNSYRSEFTNYAPDNTIFFGDFRYCAITHFGEASFIIDPYSRARENMVEFTVNIDMDITPVRSQAFSMAVLA